MTKIELETELKKARAKIKRLEAKLRDYTVKKTKIKAKRKPNKIFKPIEGAYGMDWEDFKNTLKVAYGGEQY